MLSLMLGIAIGTVFGAGALLTFSMAAIAADSERMMPEIQPTVVRPSVLTNSVESNNVAPPLQALENHC